MLLLSQSIEQKRWEYKNEKNMYYWRGNNSIILHVFRMKVSFSILKQKYK